VDTRDADIIDGHQMPAPAYRAAVQAFGEVAGALRKTSDRDELLRLVGRHICELTEIERCSVYLLDEESGLYRGQAGWSPVWARGEQPDGQERIKRLVAGTKADAFTREILETKHPVVVADTRTDPRPIQSAMRAWGIRSMLGVPMVQRDEVIGIIYLDNTDESHVFTATEIEIAETFAELAAVAISQAEMTTRLRRTLGTVAHQNDLLRRTADMDDTLARLVLRGGSLAQIAEAVVELAAKPCEIYDAEGHRLARATPAEAEAPAPTFAAVRAHPAVQAELERVARKGSGIIGPIAEAGLEHRVLYATIANRDDVSGALVILEQGPSFGVLDAHIARRAATNVALEFAAERRAARAEWDARASLAGELIRATSDPGAVRRRAQYLGVDLRAPHVVCIVGAQPEGALPSATEIAAAFSTRRGDALTTAVAEGALVVLELDEGVAPLAAIAATRADVEAVLESLSTDARPIAAVGSRCLGVEDYVRGYAEARQVLSCARSFADGTRSLVLTADDLGPGRVFLASASRAEAERFAEDAIGPLMRADDQTTRDLLRTLEVFFTASRSVRRAAGELGVHENTIRYRLARIQELTGLSIGTDSSDELTAHLALLVLRTRRLAAGDDVSAL
jgi:GAF domain-containing protein/sugar diacid utilization regulator